MKNIDRRADEFRSLQEAVLARLQGLDLTVLANLSLELTVQEFRSLEYLASSQPKKIKELAQYLGLAPNSVTDVVDAMEKKGLASRQTEPADRRVVRVGLTKTGHDAAEAITMGLRDIYRTYLSALTVDEQKTLLALYRKIANVG